MDSPHKRSHESGMDFEWANKMGPVDANSPWKNAANFSQYAGNGIAKKRTFGDLARDGSFSPASSSQTSIFSQPPQSPSPHKPSAIPARMNNAFNTPRKATPEVVDSSDADSTPGNAADSEATPDSNMGFKSKLQGATTSMVQFVSGNKELHNSHIGDIKTPSKASSRAYLTHKGEDRILKRRRRDGTRSIIRRRNSPADDTSSDESGRSRKKGRDPNAPGFVASLFSYIETHPNLPHILSWYAQLALNVFLVLFFMYLLYSFWATIRADVDKKSEEAVAELLAEMAACTKQFRENGCAAATRAPALESVCNSWAVCMNRDPRSVGRAKVSAHTFAEIFNSFIEPISIKAMVFCVVLALGAFAVSNGAFYLFRNRQPAPQHWYPPATPQHHAYTPGPPVVHSPYANPPSGYWPGYEHQQLQQQQQQQERLMGSPEKPGSQTPRRLLY